MKLQQGQTWQQGEQYIRIVAVDRMSVQYKTMIDLTTKAGTHNEVLKKEFCRLIKNATLLHAKVAAPAAKPAPSPKTPAPPSEKPPAPDPNRKPKISANSSKTAIATAPSKPKRDVKTPSGQ